MRLARCSMLRELLRAGGRPFISGQGVCGQGQCGQVLGCMSGHQARPASTSNQQGTATGINQQLNTQLHRSVVTNVKQEVSIPEIPITDFIFRNLKLYADKPALINGLTGESLTYANVRDAVWRVGSGLSRHGVRKRDVVMIVSENSIEYVIMFHAVISLGATVTTANSQYLASDIAIQVKDSGAQYIAASERCVAKCLEVNDLAQGRIKKVFVFGEEEGCIPYTSLVTDDGSAFPKNIDIDPRTHVAMLPYSSGTTGMPKGVMLTHFGEVANIIQMDNDAIISERENVVQLGMLPFYHIFAIMGSFMASLALGQTTVIIPGFDPKVFLQTILKYRISLTYAVPPIILFLNRHPAATSVDLSCVKRMICAAAPLGKEAIEEFHTKRPHCLLGQAYGMTETGPGISINPTWASAAKPSSSGPPIPLTELKILNPATGDICKEGEAGEVFVRGPQIMLGYLNKSKATAEMIDRDGWMRTGDIGYLDDENYLYICDRVKELIKYKGLQVPPAELEAVICTHPAVADAGVVGVPDAEAGELPKAFVALKKGMTLKPDELQTYVSERVVAYKKLRGGVEFISEIPRSAAGKILRRELKNLLLQQKS